MDEKALKKVMSKLPETYADTVESMSKDDLKEEVIKCQSVIVSTEKDKEEDTKLTGAKEIVKDLSSGYGGVIGTQKAKIKYIFHVMEARGYL